MPFRQIIVCFLAILWTRRTACQSVSQLDYVRPQDCTGQQFFDISHLKCMDCLARTTPTADRLGCQCAPGFKKVVDFGGLSLQCADCNDQLPTGARRMAPTPDGWDCVTCFDQSNQPIDPDPVTGLCPVCTNVGEFNYERSPFGVVQPNRTCGKCALRSYPSPFANHESCIPCNPSLEGEDCQCTSQANSLLVGGVCFGTSVLDTAGLPPENAALYTFEFPESNIPAVTSAYASANLRTANAMCIKRNLTACQLLGNLCVLNDYIFATNVLSACALYATLSSTLGTRQEWMPDMPWLYYIDNEASVELSKESAIPVSYVFTAGAPNSKINIVAAKYDLDGRFHGMEHIVGGSLQLCQKDRLILDGAFLFGRKYKLTCQIPVQDFWDGFSTLFLYDLYLNYTTDQGQQQLYALPVLDQNYRENGIYVNRLSKADNINRWKLVRRLYLVDNVIAKTAPDALAMVVRYPAYIGLNIQLQTSKNGHILPPYIVINHKEIAQEKYDDVGAQVSLTFEVSYSIDSRRHDKDIEITMGILCTVAALWAFVKTYSWQRRAGKVALDASMVIKCVLFACGALADVFLLVMLCMSLWLTIGYKGQQVAFYMLLTEDQEWSMMAYLIAALVLKTIALLHTNIELMLTDTFFIDWERPRGHVIPNDGEPGQQPPTADIALLKPLSPVVIWRTYLVANEWNELQNYRKTSVSMQVILMVFFLKWLNFEALAIAEPGATLETQPIEYQDTRMTRFAVAATLYLLIGLVQWTINVLIIERIFNDHFRNFMDLCSVANISILALTQPQFGYYIHGRSVHGHADSDMSEMNQMLQRERDNLCGQRGLEPGTEAQCFIVSLPNSFREKFASVKEPINSPNLPATRLSGADLTTSKMENVIKVYRDMNRFLTAFIDHGFSNIAYTVKNRNFLESVLDLELGDSTQIGTFFRDFSEIAYSKAFLYGNEWTHLSFDLLVFCMTDLIWHNFILAATVTFCISKLFRKITQIFYTNHLIKSSLVDKRFLI